MTGRRKACNKEKPKADPSRTRSVPFYSIFRKRFLGSIFPHSFFFPPFLFFIKSGLVCLSELGKTFHSKKFLLSEIIWYQKFPVSKIKTTEKESFWKFLNLVLFLFRIILATKILKENTN